MALLRIKKWLEKPVRFDYMRKYISPEARILDVGCGSNAPYSTFRYYPHIHYSGIDFLDIPGKADMEHFYKMDIDGNPLSEIPNNYYDIVFLSHIIEHVAKGEELITALVTKLKPGGIIYIETPSERSMKLPSWYGTLNFYDDPTHKRLYTLPELKEVLMESGCTIVRLGIRRNIKRILLSPLYAIMTMFRDKKLNATALWDMTGFAHFIIAQKK